MPSRKKRAPKARAGASGSKEPKSQNARSGESESQTAESKTAGSQDAESKKSNSQTARSRKSAARKSASRAKTSPPTEAESEALSRDDAGEVRARGCVVVGVGGSAGGLQAFKELLSVLPEQPGMAFVIVPHLDPTHESLMAELLSRHTSMPVVEAEHLTSIEPNHVYTLPPNREISIRNNFLALEEPRQQRGLRTPIDHFFRSLAVARGRRAVCVVLSGTGSDGTNGLKEVKAAGGMTIVQQPEEAEYDGMPRAALASGMVDLSLRVAEMPAVLTRYAEHPYVNDADRVTLAERDPDQFRAILNLLRAQTDFDFRAYKKGTLTRRIQRRMGLRHVVQLGDYLDLLRKDNSEARELFRDLLISVTRFFREADAWAALGGRVLGPLVASKEPGDSVRVWVPGCATGEEAYTVGMLVLEEIDLQKKHLEVQIFATDLDDDALAIGRGGAYPASIAGDISPARLTKFFRDDADTFRVSKRLRERTIFAEQNLIADPPFSNLDLISSRNVLIYLEPDVQRRVIEMFHFALKPSGHLFLGTSESVGRLDHLFEAVSSESRIYKKIGRSGKLEVPMRALAKATDATRAKPRASESDLATLTVIERAKRALLERFAPAAVLIDRARVVRYFHGPVRTYLDFPEGEPTSDIAAMVVEGLRSKLRGALQRAVREQEPVAIVASRVRIGDELRNVRLDIEPLTLSDGGETLYLVTFVDETPVSPQAGGGGADDERSPEGEIDTDTLAQLEYELQATREDLQGTIEELETSNEELKASNEEVMSMNEELQSTNEELETSREELQSLNEELSTVNNQLEDKVAELEHTNNDLTNLLSSTEIATLFLDSEFRIRRFTPATIDLLNVIETDVGRPISDLSVRFNDPDLLPDARVVLRDLTRSERDVESSDGRWFLRRIMPYRTSEDRIDGVVVTFGDVTNLKRSNEALHRRERQQATLAQISNLAMHSPELQDLFDRTVELVSQTLGVSHTKVLELLPGGDALLLRAGVGWAEGLVGTAKVGTGVEAQAGFTLTTRAPVVVEDLEHERRFHAPPLLRDHGLRSGVSVILGHPKSPWGVLGTHSAEPNYFSVDDANFLQSVGYVLTEAIKGHRAEQRLARSLAELGTIYDEVPVGLAFHDRDLRVQRINGALAKINRISIEDTLGRRPTELGMELGTQIESLLRGVLETGRPVLETSLSGWTAGHEGERRHWSASYYPIRLDTSEIAGVIAVVRETTETVRAERRRAAELAVARSLVDARSLADALPAVLDGIGTEMGFYVCEFWTRQEAGLRCVEFRCPADPDRTGELRRIFDERTFAPGEGLVGRVFESGELEWIEDAAASGRFARAEEAKQLGLQSCYGVPVNLPDETIGVMTLFAREPLDASTSSEAALQRIAFQIGEFRRRAQAEEARLASEARFRSVVDRAPIPVTVHDADDRLVLANRAFMEATGLSLEEAQRAGYPGTRLKPEPGGPSPNGGGVYELEAPNNKKRLWRIFEATARGVSGDEAGKIRMAVDVTAQQETKQQLEAARRRAEDANRVKSEFVANMSHEIRTPLGAISGFTELLKEEVTTPEARARVATIERNARHLNELLEDILHISQIEAGRLEISLEACEVRSVLGEVIDLMAFQARERGLELSLHVDPQVPGVIRSDPLRLRQILINLVSNAVKFTDEGGVRVEASRPQPGVLHVEVIDTGPGIEPEMAEKIFEPFVKGDLAARRRVGGSGLGLAISHHLAHRLGGELTFETRPDEGTTFRLQVPGPEMEAFEGAREETTAPILPDGVRVLVVEDHPDVAELFAEYLRQSGARVEIARDGAQAVDVFEGAAKEGDGFSAILLDLQLPELSGIEVARRLRRGGYEVPILAVTAAASPEDREESLAAGCDAYVVKPVLRDTLITRLALALEPAARSRPIRVLLVEDDPDGREALVELLDREPDLEVRAYGSGEEALDGARDWSPTVVLLDLGLPGMDGYEARDALATLCDGRAPRFVALTGRTEAEERRRMRERGFDDHLPKPIENIGALADFVRRHAVSR